MKYFIIASLFTLSTLFTAEPDPLQTYFDTLDRCPMGDYSKGEIEIIRDRQKIAELEQKFNRKVGIVAQDIYLTWINDAVRFPNGSYGIYARIFWTKALDGIFGVAVIPILPNGKIALNRNYRHATRSWEYELPRGGLNWGEAAEEGARREVREETGFVIDQLVYLGQYANDTGLTNSVIPVYAAYIADQQEAEPEESEAIAGIDAFSVEEIKQGFIDGKLGQIPLRDPFLTFALFQLEARKLPIRRNF